jgi:signal peptidase II
MKKVALYSIFIIFWILLDQWTKYFVRQHFHLGESVSVIQNFFSFTYVRNPGAAFGMGAHAHDLIRTIFFLIIPVIACFWLVYLIFQSHKDSKLSSLSYALILGGAIGNLIDRFYLNYVVDFLDFFYQSYHFPAFNISDSCITVGGILILI